MKYFLIFLVCMASLGKVAGQDVPPYLQYKTIPPVKLLLADSTGWELKSHLHKKKPLLLIIFSPECDHCKHETEEMIANIHLYKNVQIVMANLLSLQQMKDFVKQYGLDKYANITVGKDYAYLLPTYFGIKSLPFHAFYDKEKKLITGFEGTMTTEKILQQLKRP